MPRDRKRRQKNVGADVRIPRPANCFMIFRADWLRNSIANPTPGSHGRQQQKDVSQDAATAWKNLSPTLKQLYRVQADIIKDEHSKKYPGWVYQPNSGKKKSGAASDAPQDGPPRKRVARGRATTPYQKSSVNAKGKRKVSTTPLTSAPLESVWDGSWFSGGSSMRDPFYSAPLQPLASSTAASLPIMPPHPHFFLAPAQMNGVRMALNFPTVPPRYHPALGPGNDGFRNPERYGHSSLIPASNALSLPDFHPLPPTTTLAEPPIGCGPRIVPPNSTEESTPTVSSSTGGVPTPGSEAEPPTQVSAVCSDLTYDRLLGSYYNNNNNWEVDPAFNQGVDHFSTVGL